MDAFKNHWDRLMKEGEKWGSLSLNRRSEPKSKRDRSDDEKGGPKIEKDPNPERPVLGIQLQESADGQPEIGRVELRAPAREDGVKAGDLITKVNDTSTDKPEDVVKAVKSLKPGDKVKLTIVRDGKTLEIETKVTSPKQLERE
jgi:S1-C subfamily serine protease